MPRLIKSRKQRYVDKLIERVNYHADLAVWLEEEGDEVAADIERIVSDVFWLVAQEVKKL